MGDPAFRQLVKEINRSSSRVRRAKVGANVQSLLLSEDMSEDQFRKMLFGKRAVRRSAQTAPTDRSVYSGDRDDVPRLDIQRATSRLRQRPRRPQSASAASNVQRRRRGRSTGLKGKRPLSAAAHIGEEQIPTYHFTRGPMYNNSPRRPRPRTARVARSEDKNRAGRSRRVGEERPQTARLARGFRQAPPTKGDEMERGNNSEQKLRQRKDEFRRAKIQLSRKIEAWLRRRQFERPLRHHDMTSTAFSFEARGAPETAVKKELDVAGMAAREKALLRELSSLRLYREVVHSVRMDMCGYSKEKDAPNVRAITEGERVMLLRLKDIVSSRVPISPSVALAIAAEVLPRSFFRQV
eukprot:g1177.t1